MNDDPGLLKMLLDWSWAGVAGLIGVVYKVNSAQHEKHRENQKLLFVKIDEHSKQDELLFREVTQKMTDSFQKLTEKIHDNHVEMLRALPKRKDDL